MRHLLTACLCALLFSACASTGSSWNDETVQQVRTGMTKAELVALLGSPTSQSQTAGGGEVLIFKRASDEAGAVGKYISVMTLGARSGQNAVTVDALRVELKNGVVTNYTYTENVDNNFGQAGLQ